jgi:S-adenosylmethionine/arginine decarboxylase-like enzyme
MGKKEKRKQSSPKRLETSNMTEAEAQEAWQREQSPRHKWFRKRKRRPDARRPQFDDEMDGEADEEDAHSRPGWGRASYSNLSADSLAEGNEIMAKAAEQEAWGMASAVDIYDCDPELIRDAEVIRRFVVELCELIEMKRYGETQVVHFGEDERVAGYSMVQLIETSLISAHFANRTNAVYLDVFSCKPYNPQVVREFSRTYFQGRRASLQVAIRR